MLRRRWPTEFLIELLSLFAQPVSVIGQNGKNLRKKSGNALSIQLAFVTAYPLNDWRRCGVKNDGDLEQIFQIVGISLTACSPAFFIC
ncbi:hypothetical protein SMQE30_23150 [Serratia marcescens]|nr:hypothetical protein SMQE30_23150 [Serratia marcescens]